MNRDLSSLKPRGPLTAALVLLLPLAAHGEPTALRTVDQGRTPTPVWVTPVPDVARLVAEDEATGGRQGRIGWPIPVSLTPATSGIWRDQPDGGRVWQLEIHGPGALWLVPGFDRFDPRPGENLRILDVGGRLLAGPFGEERVSPGGEFWIPPVGGERIVVEWRQTAAAAGYAPVLRLGTVSYGYRPWNQTVGEGGDDGSADLLGGGFGTAGPCHLDINCDQGDDWQNQKRGVVKLIIAGGLATCSGSLINNTSLDCKPYVLTANHCFDQGGTAANTVFVFNFERTACGSGSASEAQFISGSIQRAQYSPSDFRLFELPAAPPAQFNVFFNGWNRVNLPATRTVMIHHPSGDAKKISVDEGPAVNGVLFGNDHWRVTFDQGTGEGGSSGAPLFNENRLIVGQLHGGLASCTAPTEPEEHGKLSVSWINGLSAWLDPTGTGKTTLAGMSREFCGALAPRLAYGGHVVDDGFGNADGVLDPGDVTRVQVRLANDGPLTATQVTATLSSTSSAVTMLDGVATWPDLDPAAVSVSDTPYFTFDVDADLVCGSQIPFSLAIASAQGNWSSNFVATTGTVTGSVAQFSDSIESGTNGWVVSNLIGTNPWVQTTTNSNSPTRSWFVDDVTGVRDSALRMPAISPVPLGGILRFAHDMDSESSSDGGVLELTTNGAVWIDLGNRILTGGYNGVILTGFGSPLAGRPAWTGDLGGWKTVEVDLSAYAGQVVLIRWRFATDTLGGDDGWYVDDVSVQKPTFACAEPRFRLFPGAICRGLRHDSPGQDPFLCGQPPPRSTFGPSRQRR